MYCNNCNFYNPHKSKFCMQCGSVLEESIQDKTKNIKKIVKHWLNTNPSKHRSVAIVLISFILLTLYTVWDNNFSFYGKLDGNLYRISTKWSDEDDNSYENSKYIKIGHLVKEIVFFDEDYAKKNYNNDIYLEMGLKDNYNDKLDALMYYYSTNGNAYMVETKKKHWSWRYSNPFAKKEDKENFTLDGFRIKRFFYNKEGDYTVTIKGKLIKEGV